MDALTQHQMETRLKAWATTAWPTETVLISAREQYLWYLLVLGNLGLRKEVFKSDSA